MFNVFGLYSDRKEIEEAEKVSTIVWGFLCGVKCDFESNAKDEKFGILTYGNWI